MHSTDIRQKFFDYFTSRGHTECRPAQLLPDDPTLLLTNAGMNQFKPNSWVKVAPAAPRLTSVQKCARTVDIARMSAAPPGTPLSSRCWKLLVRRLLQSRGDRVRVGGAHRGLPAAGDRLWVTVYLDDDESVDLWRRLGVPAGRIQRLGWRTTTVDGGARAVRPVIGDLLRPGPGGR